MNSGQYNINVNQTGPIQFRVEVITPDNLKFFSNLQCHPSQINKDSIMKNLVSKETRNQWTLDLPPESVVIEKIN